MKMGVCWGVCGMKMGVCEGVSGITSKTHTARWRPGPARIKGPHTYKYDWGGGRSRVWRSEGSLQVPGIDRPALRRDGDLPAAALFLLASLRT